MDPRVLGILSSEPWWSGPSKHICPYGSNRLEYWRPELQKIQNRCFPWSGWALCHSPAAGPLCPASIAPALAFYGWGGLHLSWILTSKLVSGPCAVGGLPLSMLPKRGCDECLPVLSCPPHSFFLLLRTSFSAACPGMSYSCHFETFDESNQEPQSHSTWCFTTYFCKHYVTGYFYTQEAWLLSLPLHRWEKQGTEQVNAEWGLELAWFDSKGIAHMFFRSW